jgi:hypothetical protein
MDTVSSPPPPLNIQGPSSSFESKLKSDNNINYLSTKGEA